MPTAEQLCEATELRASHVVLTEIVTLSTTGDRLWQVHFGSAARLRQDLHLPLKDLWIRSTLIGSYG